MENIAIGRIKNPHGLKGHLKFLSFSGEIDHLLKLKRFYVKKNDNFISLFVNEIKKNGNFLLIKFDNINDPETAKKYSNCEVYIERKNALPLDEDEFYFADLCGCSIKYDGLIIGEVISVWDNGQNNFLEIRKNTGGTFMAPFIEKYIGAVDIAIKEIELLDGEIIL